MFACALLMLIKVLYMALTSNSIEIRVPQPAYIFSSLGSWRISPFIFLIGILKLELKAMKQTNQQQSESQHFEFKAKNYLKIRQNRQRYKTT